MRMALAGVIEASTAESTRSCFEQFTLCVGKLKGAQNTHVKNRHADFKLWADSVGAFAQGQACLDWRFRDRPDDIFFVKGLLEMLEWFLKECAASSGNEKAVKEALSKIDSMVHNLISIGVAIRHSGQKSRLQKADASFDRDREKYLDLRAHLACVIVSKPSEGPRTPSDSNHFTKMELSPIQNRLVEANLRRRHRFMEAQRHSHLLKGPTLMVPGRPPMQQLTEILPTIGTKFPTEDPEIPKVKSKLKLAPTATAAKTDTMTMSGTIASTPETGFKGLQHKGHARSAVTRITAITAAARYPRANTSSIEQFSFKCPCCCQAIPTKEAEDIQFRKHLANDICPYTCILDNCPTPYKLFVTEKEWNEHFMNAHPPKFQCTYCDSTILSSPAGIMSHLQLYHPGISDDELADALAKSAVHVMGITKCPLCDSEDSPDSPELIEHILEHIHDFSLRSLPWPKDPAPNLNNVAGTFNVTVQDVNRIIQWVNKSSPKKEHQLQLRDLDRNPPMEEDTAFKYSKVDYFAQNDYFMDESSDGRFLSQSGQSYMSGSESRQSTPLKRDDPQDWETEAYDYPTHVSDVPDLSEDDFYGSDPGLSIPDYCHEETSLKAMAPIKRWRKISAVIIKQNKIRKILEAARIYNNSEHADEKPHAKAKGKRKARTVHQSDYFIDLAFSPSGWMLASASYNGTIRLWDARSGAVLQTLEAHSGSVNGVAFSPDGRMLASVSYDHTVKLWDAGSGAMLQTLEGHSSYVSAVAFTPDGRMLASASGDETVKVWDAGSGAILQTLKGHSNSVRAVAFSQDGKMLASASDGGTIRLWDTGSGATMQTLESHSGSANVVAFSPDGRMLASALDDGTIRLWDARSGEAPQTLKGYPGSVNAVAFSTDGKTLASASDDGTIRLWDAGSGAAMQTLEGYSGSVNAVAFSSDGRMLASASYDGTIRLWDVGSGETLQTLPNTITSMADLASTYQNQGQWKEAEELEVQVTETRKKNLVADHPESTSPSSLPSPPPAFQTLDPFLDIVKVRQELENKRAKGLEAQFAPFLRRNRKDQYLGKFIKDRDIVSLLDT